MSGFSPEWLALREPVDHRSRHAGLATDLAARFAGRAGIHVVDLGCGAGSNLRGMFHLLPKTQTWTLVDYDSRLLSVARERLTAWADKAQAQGETLALGKSGTSLSVHFRQADLNADLDLALGAKPDLVTAAAFFDLCSTAFIERFAAAVTQRKAAFYTALTYDGVQDWTPRHPADAAMLAAFRAHQLTDKGFGASAGWTAPQVLAASFRAHGYKVTEGASPWVMGNADTRLIADLASGFADAVSETGRIPPADLANWRAVARAAATVGHTDTLAVPA